MSEIPHPHAAHDSDCGRFACQFLVQSFFWGKCRFNLLYNIGGGLKKCYTVLRRVGGWSRIRFLHYIICERPFSARMLLAAYTLIHCRYTGRGRFRHVQHVRPNWGPTKRGPHKRTIFSIIWQHGRLLFAT